MECAAAGPESRQKASSYQGAIFNAPQSFTPCRPAPFPELICVH